MCFGLELEDRSLVSSMVVARPIHPIRSRSKKGRNLWVNDVYPPDDLSSGSGTQCKLLYIFPGKRLKNHMNTQHIKCE